MSAVGLVMWLRNTTRVRGVTRDQTRSTKSACVVTGSGIGHCTYFAPVSRQMNVQVRSIAPYSWSVVRISSPGASVRLRATMLSAVVGLGK
jgi:hypothetical protein